MSRPILPHGQGESGGQQQQQPPLQYPEPPSAQFPQQPHPQVDPSQYTPATQEHHLAPQTSPQHPQDVPQGSPSQTSSGNKPTYAKRGKITIVACVPCRKRKTKCDGQRPSCTQCLSRNGPCSYDMTDDQRKLTYLRDSVEQLQTDKSLLEQLLSTIQTASNEEAAEIFRRLRSGGDLQPVAEEIQAGKLLSGVGGGSSTVRHGGEEQQGGHRARRLPPRLDHYERLVRALALSDTRGSQDIVNRLKSSEDIPSILKNTSQAFQEAQQFVSSRRTPTGIEGSYSSQENTFGMVKGAEMRATHAAISQDSEFVEDQISVPWSKVTHDMELIQHLIDLYFTWQHSFFQSFPQRLFRNDFAAGRTKYCSSMLVNAICAAGCFLSPRPEADGLVDQFYDEAARLAKGEPKPTITTVATLYLTSYVEGTKGRLSSLWMSSGASALMAIDLNLQLKRHTKPHADRDQEAANENESRSHAFWGCFHVDQISSFTLGRLPIFNVHGVTIDVPAVDHEFDQQPWNASGTNDGNIPGARSSTFKSCSELSMLVNGTLQMFFAPTVPLSGGLLIEECQKYFDWKNNLPPILTSTENAPPHVICLHMYYHTAILLLFRPFLKAQIISRPELVPREIARQSADQISELFELHRRLYGYAGIYMFQVHCLLTACTIHIISLPLPSPTARLTAACNAFQDLQPRQEWAKSSLRILRNLARKWSLTMPKDAEEALYRDVQGRPQSPEVRAAMSPPTFAQPTDPASAFAQFSPEQGSVSSNMPSNIDPALSSAGANATMPSPHAGNKRTSSQASPSRHQPFHHNGSMTLGQKRPRMIATAHGPVAAGPPSATLGSPNSPQHAFAQQSQNPANYLYSPLAGQPAPLLRPVQRQTQGSQLAASQQLNQQQTGMSAGNIPAAPTAQMQSPTVKQENENNGSRPGSAAQNVTTQGHGRPGHAQQASGQQGGSGQNHPQSQANPNSVEGLSFSDDFRDPFMGFLEVD